MAYSHIFSALQPARMAGSDDDSSGRRPCRRMPNPRRCRRRRNRNRSRSRTN